MFFIIPIFLCFVYSWRELDSVCGASEALVDAGSDSANHSDVPFQPNGDGPEDESEVGAHFPALV